MICNLGVVGSNPTRGSVKIFLGQLPEWTNGADCNSAGYAFGGSNPSLPTKTICLENKYNNVPKVYYYIKKAS